MNVPTDAEQLTLQNPHPCALATAKHLSLWQVMSMAMLMVVLLRIIGGPGNG